MNFEQIKKKYPKAWGKFVNFFGYKCLDFPQGISAAKYLSTDKWKLESLSGWLFKFFDEQGIVIVSNPDEQDKYKTWLYEICIIGHWEHIECNFKSRQEAEQAAFTKAFEILEDKT